MERADAGSYAEKELLRERAFQSIWSERINAVFSDVATYYDRANVFATLGLIDPLRLRFVSTMEIPARGRVLDVCAGTNVIGIELGSRHPGLDLYAVDRSMAMQQVGRRLAQAKNVVIRSVICDVDQGLPFPEGHFDAVTLQWATRHVRAAKVFAEIRRVLKPGGRFYHCDMLRPANKVVEQLYYMYLKGLLALVPRAFGSGSTALSCREYFVDAIRLFYSVDELSELMRQLGFRDVEGRAVLGATVGFHKARKPLS